MNKQTEAFIELNARLRKAERAKVQDPKLIAFLRLKIRTFKWKEDST